MTMPFVLECRRSLGGRKYRTLRECHDSLDSALVAMADHQQGPWESMRLIPVGPGTPLRRGLEQLWLLLEETV